MVVHTGTQAGAVMALAMIILLAVNACTDPVVECVGSHPVTDMELTHALDKCAELGITIPEEYYP